MCVSVGLGNSKVATDLSFYEEEKASEHARVQV